MADTVTNLLDTKTAICKKCGKEFSLQRSKITGRWNYRLYCSDCSGPEKTKTVVCQQCGKPFVIERVAWGGFSGRKYCDNCDMTKRKTKTLICQKCGKPFEVNRRKDHGGFIERKYCPNCYQDNQLTKTLICQDCGKEFTVDRYETTGIFKYRKYCNDCMLKDEYITCKKCGKTFKKYRTKQERNYSIFCTDCRRENWLEKAVKTCQEKYDVDYPCQRYECFSSNGITISKVNVYFHDSLATKGISSEYEKIIGTYSYDLFVDSDKIVIEINPTYTHNVFGNHFNHWKYDKSLETHHVNKTNMAIQNGYRCIHVWQWDDWDKVISLIEPKTKLYARKLQLKEITKQEANEFLNEYHLQNSCYGNSINLGLYLGNNELVQVMTFGKPRYNKNYQWELLRLCTKANYYIVGGAEKLFKHFIRIQDPESIISYCDISKFTGDVYTKLGFNLKEQTKPQKIWTENNYNYGNNKYITDNLLRQRGFDQLFNTNYGKGTDNEQLMLEHGWLPIYDCGQKVFIWCKPSSVNKVDEKEK